MDGMYLVIGIENQGTKVSDAEIKAIPKENRMVVIKGEEFSSYLKDKNKPDRGIFKTDTSKSPAEMDISQTSGEGKKYSEIYIYKIEGDILTMHGGNVIDHTIFKDGVREEIKLKRPTDFKTSKDNNAVLIVLQLQREKR